MAASKLTPAERLIRKRKAARLRQQRCRARKRMALMQKRAEAAANLKAVSPKSSSEKLPNKVLPVPSSITISRFQLSAPHSPSPSEDRSLRPGYWSGCESSDCSGSLSLTERSYSIDSTSVNSSSSFETKSSDDSSLSEVTSLPPDESAAIDAMLALRLTAPKKKVAKKIYKRPTLLPPKYSNYAYHNWPEHYLPKYATSFPYFQPPVQLGVFRVVARSA